MEKLIIKACDEAIYNNYKSFNELIERLENVKNAIKEHNYGIAMDILCKSYPEFQITTSTELKESDDRIRKALITFFNRFPYTNLYDSGLNAKDVISWLEKQGEQKPAIIIQKFRVGDEIKTNNEESLTITKIDEKGYWSDDLFICSFEDSAKWELVEQKPAWSEEDERMMKSLTFLFDNISQNIKRDFCVISDVERDNYENWLKSLKDRVQPQPKQEWSEKYIADVFEKVGLAKIAREQGYDALTEAIQSAMIELSKFTPQPKQEWSEKDEHWRQKAIDFMKHPDFIKATPTLAKNTIDWLKSLKDRVQPKQEWSEDDEERIKNILSVLSVQVCWDGATGKKMNPYQKEIDWLKSLQVRIGRL